MLHSLLNTSAPCWVSLYWPLSFVFLQQLAKKYHPDANPGDKEASKKFAEISEAYETLGDKTKRAQYDATGGQGSKFWVNIPCVRNIGECLSTPYRYDFDQLIIFYSQHKWNRTGSHNAAVGLRNRSPVWQSFPDTFLFYCNSPIYLSYRDGCYDTVHY